MCFGGSPPTPPKPPQEEQKVDEAAGESRDEMRRRLRAGAYSTYDKSLLTGGMGLTAPASTAQKSLLGA